MSSIKQLFRSRNAHPAVLKFLATTRLGGTQQIQDQEQQERRRRQDKVRKLNKERLKGEERRDEGRQTGDEEGEEKKELRGG